MKLDINPTRMELLNLRKRLSVALRGYKMLKDKVDELIRRFLELVEQNQGLRAEVEKRIIDSVDYFTMAKGAIDEQVLRQVLTYNNGETSVISRDIRILNLLVPEFEVSIEGDINSYGFDDTTLLLDASLALLARVLPEMVKLAQLEKSIQLLAEEIETTRRRVNALEYVLIPAIEETIHYIRMKLEERERSTLTRLMKVKEIIQNK